MLAPLAQPDRLVSDHRVAGLIPYGHSHARCNPAAVGQRAGEPLPKESVRDMPAPARHENYGCRSAACAVGVKSPGRCIASSHTARASSRLPLAGRRSATHAGPAVEISPWIGAMPW
jgi:hypothetical protein